MKLLLLIATVLLFITEGTSQPLPCKSYDCAIKRAEKYINVEEYKKAFDYLQSAEGYPDANFDTIILLRRKLFLLIEKKKKYAEMARDTAEIQRKRADSLSNVANKARDSLSFALEQMNLSQNSVRDANKKNRILGEQKALSNELAYLQRLGQQSFTSKQYKEALEWYNEGKKIIDSLLSFDKSDTTRLKDLRKYIHEADSLLNKQIEYDNYIILGDSLTRKEYFLDAYKAYFKALDLGYDNETTYLKLSQLERLLGDRPKSNRNFLGAPYFELLALSAKANLHLKNNDLYTKRLNAALRLNPVESNFASYPMLQPDILSYKNKFIHRLEVSGGIKIYFPSFHLKKVLEAHVNRGKNIVDYPFAYFLTSLCISYRIAKPFWLDIGFTNNIFRSSAYRLFDNFPDLNNINEFDSISNNLYRYPTPKLNELFLSSRFDIIKIINKKWKTYQFSLQLTGGVTYGSASLGFSNKYIELAFDHDPIPEEYISNVLNSTNQQIQITINNNGESYSIINPNYGEPGGANNMKSYLYFLSCKNILIQLPYSNAFNKFKYYSGNIGFSSQFVPFPKYGLHLIGEISYTFPFQQNNKKLTFNLGSEMHKNVENKLNANSIYKNNIIDYYLQECDIDISIDKSYFQFYSGLNIRLGIGIRF